MVSFQVQFAMNLYEVKIVSTITFSHLHVEVFKIESMFTTTYKYKKINNIQVFIDSRGEYEIE